MGVRYLTMPVVLYWARQVAVHLFPAYEPDVALTHFAVLRDRDRLDAALAQPRWDYYETIEEKAGALYRGIVKGHPFVDGNKRMGIASAHLFLAANGRFFTISNEEMVAYTLHLAASSPPLEVTEIADWIRYNSTALEALEAQEHSVLLDLVRETYSLLEEDG